MVNVSLGPDILLNETLSNNIIAMLFKPGVLENNSCQQPACVYNPSTMSSAIDLRHCFFTSFGEDISGTNTMPVSSGTLNKAQVSQMDPSCTILDPSTPGAECFSPEDAIITTCMGDLGAPMQPQHRRDSAVRSCRSHRILQSQIIRLCRAHQHED